MMEQTDIEGDVRPRRRSRKAAWVATLAAAAFAMSTNAAKSLDEQLLAAVTNRDLGRTQWLLGEGADPNTALGRNREEKALCMATAPGNGRVLHALLDAGADANVLYAEREILSPDPLGCASSFENLEAFDMLVRAGADPDRDVCPDCTSPWPSTMTLYNAAPQRFHIAWYLIQTTTVSEGEVRALMGAIESSPIPTDDPTLDERDLIVEWLRERGLEVNPIEPFEKGQ